MTDKRYGIIPCSRCAFWCLPPHGDDEEVTVGQCRRHPAVFPATEDFNRIYNQEQRDEFTGFWPATCSGEGCGDGLLREEAAPLPPEPKP